MLRYQSCIRAEVCNCKLNELLNIIQAIHIYLSIINISLSGDYRYMDGEMPDFEQFVVQVIRREDVMTRIKEIKPHKHSTQVKYLFTLVV